MLDNVLSPKKQLPLIQAVVLEDVLTIVGLKTGSRTVQLFGFGRHDPLPRWGAERGASVSGNRLVGLPSHTNDGDGIVLGSCVVCVLELYGVGDRPTERV
jgi:hypothetical protein